MDKNNKTKNKTNKTTQKKSSTKNEQVKTKSKKETEKNIEKTENKKGQNKQGKEIQGNKLKAIIENRRIIISFSCGLLVGLLIMLCFIPTRIAKLKDGTEVIAQIDNNTITADQLYNDMKQDYSINTLLNKIDNIILEKIYPETNEMKEEVNKTANYYISTYESYYGYSQDEFLQTNNFDSYESYLKYLTLNYRRDLYYNEYLNGLVEDNEIRAYYDTNVYGDIETKYISVEFDKDKEKAKKIIDEILKKLNSGIKYDEIIKEYKDKITTSDMKYQSFDSDLGLDYMKVLTGLNDNSYSKEIFEDTKSYKIIFRGKQKEKAEFDKVSDNIRKLLAKNLANNDANLYYKSLINLREKNKVSFKDTDLSKKYNKYKKKYLNSK